MNKLIEEQICFDVSFFIIDEFHLIQDEQRGWMLETILSKLKTIEKIFDKPNAF
jgi:replicative superfamily II helicase